LHQKILGKFEGVIGLLLNGLGAESAARMATPATALGRRPWMVVENESNNRLIMPTPFWCTVSVLLTDCAGGLS